MNCSLILLMTIYHYIYNENANYMLILQLFLIQFYTTTIGHKNSNALFSNLNLHHHSLPTPDNQGVILCIDNTILCSVWGCIQVEYSPSPNRAQDSTHRPLSCKYSVELLAFHDHHNNTD